MRRARVVIAEVNAQVPQVPCAEPLSDADIDFLVETFGGEDADPWLKAAGCETPQTGPDQNV